MNKRKTYTYGTYAYYSNLIRTTTPFVKGQCVGKIPIGDRRRNWEQIRREGDDIVISFGAHDCLRFKKNGQVVINTGRYQYYSFINFTSRHLQWSTNLYMDRGAICLRNALGVFRVPDDTDYALYSTMRPINPVKEVRWYVNRKAMAKVRATVAGFRKYVKLMFNLVGKEPHEYMDFSPKAGLVTITDAKQIVTAMQGEDSEQWYATLQHAWHSRSMNTVERMITRSLTAYYGNKVMRKEVLPYGEWKREINKPPV